MPIPGVIKVTIALFLGIAALTLHLLALCSPHWKITHRHDVEPAMAPVSYGLWQRCEYLNNTIQKQGIAIGIRPNIETCWPNRYMRYSPENYNVCYNFRRHCPIIQEDKLPEGCACRYLRSTAALQWLTILAAVFLVLGLLLLYLKTIASPQNDSALLVLGYGPFVCFLLALLLMITGLILVGAYFRRDVYEDYSFPVTIKLNGTEIRESFDLYSLRNFAKHNALSLHHESYVQAEQELINDTKTHFHTRIGQAFVYEIIAASLVLIITGLSFWLGTASRSEDI